MQYGRQSISYKRGRNRRIGNLNVEDWGFGYSKTVVRIVRTTCSDNPFTPIEIIRMSRKCHLNER